MRSQFGRQKREIYSFLSRKQEKAAPDYTNFHLNLIRTLMGREGGELIYNSPPAAKTSYLATNLITTYRKTPEGVLYYIVAFQSKKRGDKSIGPSLIYSGELVPLHRDKDGANFTHFDDRYAIQGVTEQYSIE